MSRRIARLGLTQFDQALPGLVALLTELVNRGASLGFVPPARELDCRNYWSEVRAELQTETRLVFGAWVNDQLAGSCQLALPRWPNARHRAEVHKVMVATRFQGQGIGRAMLDAVHHTALKWGRSLLLLSARQGDRAELFYRALGYQEIGVVPGYSLGPEGETYSNVMMYLRLGGGTAKIRDQRSDMARLHSGRSLIPDP